MSRRTLGTAAVMAAGSPPSGAPLRSLATPAEVAEFLQVPEKTLAEWRSQGKGPAYRKVGKHVRYRWLAVEKWFDEQDGGGEAEQNGVA